MNEQKDRKEQETSSVTETYRFGDGVRAEDDPKRFLREIRAAFATIAHHRAGGDVKDFALAEFAKMPLPLIDLIADSVGEAQRLRSALTEIRECLDGIGADITRNSVLGDNIDYVSRARYFAEVALGNREEFPEQEQA